MTWCELSASPDIELYFYGELDAASRARVDAHLAGCAECRQQLDDLRAIASALAGVPRVEAPPAGEWAGFMRRLDEASGMGAPPPRSTLRAWMPVLAVAAAVEILVIGMVLAGRMHDRAAAPAPRIATAQPPVTSGRSPAAATTDRLLRAQTEDLIERSTVVVVGLATRDARHTSPADWDYERTLAGSLLGDTRLFRLAAQRRGMSDVAATMGDLETVLLEASLSDDKDPEALERVQRLIHKRDLLLKMQVARAGI